MRQLCLSGSAAGSKWWACLAPVKPVPAEHGEYGTGAAMVSAIRYFSVKHAVYSARPSEALPLLFG